MRLIFTPACCALCLNFDLARALWWDGSERQQDLTSARGMDQPASSWRPRAVAKICNLHTTHAGLLTNTHSFTLNRVWVWNDED